MDSTTEGNQLSAERSEYYSQIQKHSMAPLWENLNHLLTPEPEVKSVPHLWDYSELRTLLLESADVISAAEAERRVLMLENPGLPGNCSITFSTDFIRFTPGMPFAAPGEPSIPLCTRGASIRTARRARAVLPPPPESRSVLGRDGE